MQGASLSRWKVAGAAVLPDGSGIFWHLVKAAQRAELRCASYGNRGRLRPLPGLARTRAPPSRAEPVDCLLHKRRSALQAAFDLGREFIKTRRTQLASARLFCSGQLRRNGEVEAGMKSDDLTDDSKVAVELTDLAAQLSDAIGQRDRIVRIVRIKKVTDRGLDKRGLRRPTALGGGRQSRCGAFGEIDANPRFHHSTH